MVLDGEGQDRGHLVMGAGADHGVGCVGQVARALPEQVGRRLATSTQPAGLVIGEHVLGAEQVPQPLDELGREAGGRQRDDLDGEPLVEAEDHLDQPAGGVRQLGGGGRVAPPAGVHLGLYDG